MTLRSSDKLKLSLSKLSQLIGCQMNQHFLPGPAFHGNLLSLCFRHRHVSDDDFLRLQQLQRLNTLEILDSYYRPDPSDPSWVVYEPSPRLLQLISDLQKLTNHRVRVVTSSHRDPLTCHCVWPIKRLSDCTFCDVTVRCCKIIFLN